MIFLFLSLVFLEPRAIFGSSASSLGFSVTFTNKKILETFINGTEKAKSSRLCGLACLSRSFCRSFNFQWRSHYCEFLITDSRLLGQEHLLGKSCKEPDWVLSGVALFRPPHLFWITIMDKLKYLSLSDELLHYYVLQIIYTEHLSWTRVVQITRVDLHTPKKLIIQFHTTKIIIIQIHTSSKWRKYLSYNFHTFLNNNRKKNISAAFGEQLSRLVTKTLIWIVFWKKCLP